MALKLMFKKMENLSNLQKILIVDDHQIVYSGIQLIMQTAGEMYEYANSKNGTDCINILKKNHFDLVILDVNLPDTDTYQLIGLILLAHPKQKILMFSMSSEEMYAKRFLKLGARGFISKQTSNEEFIHAVSTVLNGEIYVSAFLSKLFTQDVIRGNNANNAFDTLTAREFEIMSYFLSGRGSKEICNVTHLHSSTIGTYKFRIFEKLGVKNLLELQEVAQLNGIKGIKIESNPKNVKI